MEREGIEGGTERCRLEFLVPEAATPWLRVGRRFEVTQGPRVVARGAIRALGAAPAD